MTDAPQTNTPVTTQPLLDPATILLTQTGCATADQLTARMAVNRQEMLNLRYYNQVLQVQERPFAAKAEKRETKAKLLGIGAFAMAGFTPVGAAVLGVAAIRQIALAGPDRAVANQLNREIKHNGKQILQDAAYNNQGEQALVAAQQADTAVQAARRQQAVALQFNPPMGTG